LARARFDRYFALNSKILSLFGFCTVVKSGIMIKCFFYFFPMKVFVKTPDRGPGNPTEVNLIKLCKKIAKATTSFFNESHLCIDKAHRSRLRGIGSPVTSCNDD
jgi:hypothetical protein